MSIEMEKKLPLDLLFLSSTVFELLSLVKGDLWVSRVSDYMKQH